MKKERGGKVGVGPKGAGLLRRGSDQGMENEGG